MGSTLVKRAGVCVRLLHRLVRVQTGVAVHTGVVVKTREVIVGARAKLLLAILRLHHTAL